MNENVLNINELDYAIDGTSILSSISLSVKKHEFVGLIGPNGCGKSTLLKNIYRHYTPDNGAILLNGSNISEIASKEMARQMAVVAQENQPDFDFSVLEMLMMGRYSHKKLFEGDNAQDYQLCRNALQAAGLPTLEKRSFLSLSGGEKQRIYLAMAFVQESPLIILDEPTNHLDIGYQLSIMETLKKLEDKTIFASIHDMNLAAQYCDRLIAMSNGKIITVGSPEQVLTKELLADIFHVNVLIEKRNTDNKLQITYLNYIQA